MVLNACVRIPIGQHVSELIMPSTLMSRLQVGLANCVFIFGFGCSSDDSRSSPMFDANETVAHLSDAQIAALCADVAPQPACEVGGERGPRSYDDTAADCVEKVTRVRDDVSNAGLCFPAKQFETCWRADPCEPASVACRTLECPPDFDACYEKSVDDCESEFCFIRNGRLPNADGTCLEEMPAYCSSRLDTGCDTVETSATDPSGTCWKFSSSCELPDTWTLSPASCEEDLQWCQ